MSVQLRTIPLTSDEILQELIMDSLPQLLGASCEVISHNLPFEGNHLLCLDADKHPTVVSFDSRDGGRALLAGLAVIEGLSDNRGMLYRLYPALFTGNAQRSNSIFRSEDLRLVILSSKVPPGMAYLAHAFPALTAFTFRILEVDSKIGLLIEPPQRNMAPAAAGDPSLPSLTTAFRTGDTARAALSPEEAHYFKDA